MTDLLRPSRTAPSSQRARDRSEEKAADLPKSLAYGAALAGVGSPAVALLVLWAVGLVGWFASDGGSHGTTRSVLRVAADGWLLAHGAHLTVGPAVVTASPLGLTLACAYLTYRFAVKAGRVCDAGDLRTVGWATVVLGGVYGVVAMLVAILAAVDGAQPGFALALVGGAFVGGVSGGIGLVRGAGLLGELRSRVPMPALGAAYTALTTLAIFVAVGAVLTAVSLTLHEGAAARVADTLKLDLVGGVFSVLLVAVLAPNFSLLATTYLLGPGFAVGVGTVVSPSAVSVGPVPAVPALAALPSDGWAPGWTVAFLAVPVLVAVTGAWLAGRTIPTSSYQSAAVRGLCGGLAATVLLAIAVSFAGGSIGPDRMSDLGTGGFTVLLAAVRSLVPGALAGALIATWRARRGDVPDAEHALATESVMLTTTVPRPRTPHRGTQRETQRRPPPQTSDLSGEDTVALRLPPPR